MNLKSAYRGILRFLGHYFAAQVVTLLCRSLRVNFQNRELVTEFEKNNSNYVLAFWHGTMMLPWYLHGKENFAALISKSKDGDLLARILKKWKYSVVRGSSSSGGSVALGIMVDYARNRFSLAVTPDGPRGPAHKFKAGALITAKKSGIPLVLAGIGYQKKKVLKSWDRFEVPHFFSKAKVIYSDPLFIDQSLGYDETNKLILNCEKELNRIQAMAEEF